MMHEGVLACIRYRGSMLWVPSPPSPHPHLHPHGHTPLASESFLATHHIPLLGEKGVNIEVGELRKLMQEAQLAAEKEKAIFGEVGRLI